MNILKQNKKSEANWKGIICAVLATFAARFLGFIRELFVADVFGTSALGDAFIVSLSIPDILVSGFTTAIATLYIPTYYKVLKEKHKNPKDINEYNSSVLGLLIIICILITVLTEIFTKFVVNIFAPGFDTEIEVITIQLLRIVIISVIPIGISGLFKAYGQIVNEFSLLTLVGVTINLSVIIALVIFKDKNLSALAWSVLLGNIIYLILCFIIVKHRGFRCSKKISLKNKYLSSLIIGILPVFISNIVSEINQIIDKNFASQLSEGSISALNYSSKIINLITAIIGTAISSVLFANLSKIATEGNKGKMAKEVERINSIVITMIMPLFLFILLFSKSIVQILFGRGQFGEESVIITAECLSFYSIGVIGFNLKAIWVRIYNASLDTKTPAINSGIAVICNILLNILLISIMQHRGLALATGLASIITDLLLIVFYKKSNAYFNLKHLIIETFKIIISCLGFILLWWIINNVINGSSNFINVLKWGIWFIGGSILYILGLIVTNSNIGLEIRKYIHI